MTKRSLRRVPAFTLIELLVVIAIIAILISLLVPAVQKVRDAAARVKCSNNVHQIALATHSYESVNRRFPPGLNYPGANNFPDAPQQGKVFGLHVAIMPYLEKGDLVNGLDLTSEYQKNTASQTAVGALPVPTFLCPGDSSMPTPPVATYNTYYFALSSYGGCSGTSATSSNGTAMLKNGIFFTNSRVRIRDVTDGTSNTLLIGERSRSNLQLTSSSVALGGWAWANSNSLEDHTMNTSTGKMEGILAHDLNDFGSMHGSGSGANFAFADGSVRFLFKEINFQAYQRISTRAGGEVVDLSSFQQ